MGDRDEDRWSRGTTRESPGRDDRRDDCRDDHRGDRRDDRREDRRDDRRRDDRRDHRHSRSPERRRSRSPRRDDRRRHSRSPSPRPQARSPASLTPTTRRKQRSEAVDGLSYVIYDYHKEHKYEKEDDRKRSRMLSLESFGNYFAEGPIGTTFKQGIKTQLGFKKLEDPILMVGLKGDKEGKQMIDDKASFKQYQNYLIQSSSSVIIDAAGIIEVEMHVRALVKNLIVKDESEEKTSHRRDDVQLMNQIKKEANKKTSWTTQCAEILANSGRADKELKKFQEARNEVQLVFGDAKYLLNPVMMLCPFDNCKKGIHMLNGLSSYLNFYSPKNSHLKEKHKDDPAAQALLKRLEAVAAPGGKELTPEELDAKEGCALKLDSDWLDVNMQPEAGAPKLAKLRKPASYEQAIFCIECADEDARAAWITANKSDIMEVD